MRRMRPGGMLVSWRLSVVLAAVMALQGAVGLAAPGLYRDVEWVTAAWYGNDLVTLVVAAPLLCWSLWAVHQGSVRAELVWYAMLGYGVYNYAYYLFGARLNWFFPLYLILFVLPVFALILALGRLDAADVAGRFSLRTPVRWVGGYMLFTGVGLALAWMAQWANFMLTGAAPAIGEEAFQLVAAIDLTFMVPWFLLGAILLIRRRPWGFVIAPIIVTKGATYTLVLTTTSTVAALRDVSDTAGEIPIWAAWTVAGAAALWGLLANLDGPTGRRKLAATFSTREH